MNAFRLLMPLAMLSTWPALSMAGELAVTASTPDVEVSTRPAGRNFVQLPDLRYHMVLTMRCPDLLSARAVSLSIADTRIALDAERLMEGPQVEVSIDVPATQIAPVAIEDFCSGDDPETTDAGAHSLEIPSVLSAQAALTCASEDRTEMTYASASLDVHLRCVQDDESATDSIH